MWCISVWECDYVKAHQLQKHGIRANRFVVRMTFFQLDGVILIYMGYHFFFFFLIVGLFASASQMPKCGR